MKAISEEDLKEIIDSEISKFHQETEAEKLKGYLRPPQKKVLKWEYGNNEECYAWLFADLDFRDIWIAYCMDGHGALGSPWGLVRRNDEYFGMDSQWFPSLEELFQDWSA